MITDIVGYSKLSGDNQGVALELLKEHDKILFNSLEISKGNVLKNRGDGVISQFKNYVESIHCAVDIQRKLSKRNSLNIKERKLNVRIGIHYGEYIKEGDEIHGDCIHIASKLEPLAPTGGIVISQELCEKVKDIKDIYIREFKIVSFENNVEEMIYEVYFNIFKWYNNEENKNLIIPKSNLLSNSHDFFHDGDYSSAIKNTVLFKESQACTDLSNVNLFLVNLFISIGFLKESEKILSKILSESADQSDEFKAHLFKLEGHLFFNKKKWKSAHECYDKALKIFVKNKSKYVNEIYFYKGMIDIVNETNKLSFKNKLSDCVYRDIFFQLLTIQKIIFQKNKKNYDINKDINRVKKIENNRMQAYGFWLLSKILNQLKMFDDSYFYETQAQKYIKLSSEDISDSSLRNNFLEKIYLHKMILTETSITVDELFDFNDELSDEFDDIENFNVFNYCVNCGLENIEEVKKCSECDSILVKEYYDKN